MFLVLWHLLLLSLFLSLSILVDERIHTQVRPLRGVNYVVFSAAAPEHAPMRIENATVADSIRVTQRGTQLWRECAPMTEQVRLPVCVCVQKTIG